jgi:hypothetical protein
MAGLGNININPEQYNIGIIPNVNKYNYESGNELQAQLFNSIGHDYDYSLARGQNARGHYTDAGKLPWHPTFSTGSNYNDNTNQGGTWDSTTNEAGANVDRFTPSPQMMQEAPISYLGDYFKHVEPQAILQAPAPYDVNAMYKNQKN